jgi:hypothetical protein
MRVEQGHGERDGRRLGARRERTARARVHRLPARSLGATSLLLAALTAALAGCGSSAPSGTSADPAGAAPSSTLVYIGAVVRPDGSLKTGALADGRTLTGQKNPYTHLLGALQTPGSPTLDFSHDVAPWLGPNAGLFFTSVGSSEAITSAFRQTLTTGGTVQWPFSAKGAQGAIVLDTSNLADAKTFVANAAAHANAHATSYKGVAYQASAGGDASFAVVDRYVVLGTETGVRDVIETTQTGSSLKSYATYSQLQAVAPAGALAHVYGNPAALNGAHAAGAHASASAHELPPPLGMFSGTRPLNISLVPSSSTLALDADIGPPPAGATGTQSGGLVEAAAAGNQALGELPGESWLAAGLSNTGGTVGGNLHGIRELLSLVGTLGSSGAGEGAAAPQAAISVPGLLEGLLTPLNALDANTPQARHDFLSWMGDAGVFASGASILELKGGVSIDSTDPAASRAAVGSLATALRKAGAEATPVTIPGTEAAIEAKITGLPVTLVIADGRSSDGHAKFVLGLGEPSVQDALNPPSTMSSAASYSAAQTALGEGIQPSVTVSFPKLVSLLEGVGLSEAPPVSTFLPYLRASTTLAGGGKGLGGGIERLRLVLGLQPPSSG